jgi:hypothetical protein
VFGNASAFAKVRLNSKGIKWMHFHMLFDVLDISISKTIQKHLKTSELMLFQPKYTLKSTFKHNANKLPNTILI